MSNYVQCNGSVLEKLNAADCKFSGTGSITLFNSIRRNANLKYITVDKNDVRTRNTGYLISTIYHGVTYLSMNRCNLGEDGGVSIAEGLSRSR